VTDFVGDAVGQRMAGGRPSALRSVGAALVIGVGAALLAYRLLRSRAQDGDQAED
jgi:hypothetical protein